MPWSRSSNFKKKSRLSANKPSASNWEIIWGVRLQKRTWKLSSSARISNLLKLFIVEESTPVTCLKSKTKYLRLLSSWDCRCNFIRSSKRFAEPKNMNPCRGSTKIFLPLSSIIFLRLSDLSTLLWNVLPVSSCLIISTLE